jgi:tetratricopeptide (TPR) repeat protein/DNA-binding CsgD family transcriptional regulator
MNPETDSIQDRVARQLLIAGSQARKLAVIVDAMEALRRDDPAAAAELASDGYCIATATGDAAAEARILKERGLCRIALSQSEAALEDLDMAYKLFADLGMPDEAGTTALVVGNVHHGSGRTRDAMLWHESARDCGRDGGIPGLHADALDALAELRTSMGDYPAALDLYRECHAIREGAGDTNGAGKALSAIGMICGLTGDFDGAFAYFSRSLAAFRDSGNRLQEVRALANLGSVHYTRDELDTAFEYGVKAMTIYEALGDMTNAGRALVMIGNIHERAGRANVALECQMRAYAHLDGTDDNELRIAILLNLARLDMAADAANEALFILNQALEIATAIDEPRLRYEVHEALASIHEKQGHTAAALEHYKQFARIRNDLAGSEKQKSLAEFQARFDVALAEREREIYRLRAEALETEMRLKQNELAAMALNLVGKKELLDAMKKQLEQLGRDGEESGSSPIEKLVREIESTQRSDGEWKMFEQQLDNLHQDFVRILSERFPTLTPTELKICSLTRINLQTKDIANLLFTSPRTVHAHKYNIRKKLKLASNMNLTTFLAGL